MRIERIEKSKHKQERVLVFLEAARSSATVPGPRW